MIVIAYLLSVAVALVALATALRRRPTAALPTPPTPTPAPAALPDEAQADIRVILAAAAQLAARLTPAA
ncbi:hypothetical protein [Streptomyces sp. AA1529]|uniref:hypothetical protein n=1 Tax=Streptomyces sp. AA1529 TaxID=1203257 RepID=UPI003D7030BB